MTERLSAFAHITRQSGKIRVGKILSSPFLGWLIAKVCGNRIRNRGVTIDTSPPEFTKAVKAQLAFGIYEGAEVRFIRKYLRGYSKAIELGSSLGITAAHIVDVAAHGAEVVCVEANPKLLSTLRLTIAAAAKKTSATVRTIHGAVPPDPTLPSPIAMLQITKSNLGGRADRTEDHDMSQRLPVPVVNLDELAPEWDEYALVCDIEGTEAGLILSSHPILTRASRLVIELHDTTYAAMPVTVADMKKALLDLGFLPLAENGRVMALDGPRKTIYASGFNGARVKLPGKGRGEGGG